MRVEPVRSAQCWFVGAGEDVRYIGFADNLGHKRRLADLPGARYDLDEAAWLTKPPEQLGSLRAPVLRVAHDSE